MKQLKSKLKQYQGGYRAASIPCEVCGVKNKKGEYYRTWIETSWFRGDDACNGNLCGDCYKQLRKENKQSKVTESI